MPLPPGVTEWVENYGPDEQDPLAQIRAAMEADKAAQRQAEANATIQRGIDMFVQRSPKVEASAVRPVDDNMKAWLLARQAGQQGTKAKLDEAELDLRRQELENKRTKAPDLDNQPAPPDWGALPGMTRSEALRAGFGHNPKADKDKEMAPPEWHDRLRKMGIRNPQDMYRDEAMKLLQADIGRAGQVEAAVGAETRRGEREAPEKNRDAASTLRKELQNQQSFKDLQQVGAAYEKMQKTADSGAGDISLIFSYMKMVDPGSTVREGEFATAQQSSGIPGRIVTAYNNALNGQKLNPEQRAAFRAEAKNLLAAQYERYKPYEEQYRNLAKRYGIDPDEVVLDFGFGKSVQQDQAQPAPAAAGTGPVVVKTKAERDALPPGTRYQREGDPAVYTKR